MPYDPRSGDDDEDEQSQATVGSRRRFVEFDCPLDDGFGDGDEVLCNYCGQELRALVSDEGKLRLRAL
jgi:hypothetical protein